MFKVGDRVECVDKYFFAKSGDKGNVVCIQSGIIDSFLIEWDKNVGGHNGRLYYTDGSDGVQRGKDGHCEWMPEENIKLIEERENMKDMLKVGRVVQTRDGAYGIVLGHGISFKNQFMMISTLNENLECKSNKLADIMVVFETSGFISIDAILNGVFDFKEVWRRGFFTGEDIDVAKLIPKNWKYIARDRSEELYLFESKPYKSDCTWIGMKIGDFNVFKDGFESISFNDEYPTLIEDIIKFSF